jgi:transcription elongation factor Elf1
VSEKKINIVFQSEKEAIEHYINVRYKGIITCPHCGSSTKISRRNDRSRVIQCNACNKSFSVFKGTVFEKSNTDIRIWFDACKALLNDKKGMPALLFQRQIMSNYNIHITYKCVWRIFNKIRTAMSNIRKETFITKYLETDETYIGSSAKNFKGENKKGRGTHKTAVHGIFDRYTGKVRMHIMNPDEDGKKITGKQLQENIDKYCKDGALIITDDFSGYKFLDKPNEKNINIVRLIILKNNIVKVVVFILII